MFNIIYFIAGIIGYIWAIVGVIFLAIIVSDRLVRLAKKYRINCAKNFDITNLTLIDQSFDTADSFEHCEWYPEYKKEATQVFFNPTWSPYTYWKSKSRSGKYINVVKGLRQTWQVKTLEDKHSSNIFCFGGSTMWGWGARDNYTIASILSKLCNQQQAKGRVKITNYSQLGYVSTQCVIDLFLQLQKNKIPDVVIFYDGLNDIFSAYQACAAGLAQNEFNRKFEFESTFNKKLLKQIVAQSPTVNYLKELVIGSPKVTSQVRPDRLIISLIDAYKRNVNIVTALGKQYGFKALFYWQPVLFTKQHLTPFESQLYENHKFWEDFYYRTEVMLRNKTMMPENFHNISTIFSEYSAPLYIDPWHVNENGNTLIAERMFEDLREQIMLPDELPQSLSMA